MATAITLSAEPGKAALIAAASAADRIRRIQNRMVTDIVEIGNTLLAVKEAVGHGHFLPWLKAEFGWTERSAQNYMSVAERFGQNPKPISHLPLATVYKLAAPSTPAAVREQIVQRIEAGEAIEPSIISYEVASARREAEQAKRDAKKPERQQKRERTTKERLEASRKASLKKYEDERNQERIARGAVAALIVQHLPAAHLASVLDLLAENTRISRNDLEVAVQQSAA